jgi:hypothetical protein
MGVKGLPNILIIYMYEKTLPKEKLMHSLSGISLDVVDGISIKAKTTNIPSMLPDTYEIINMIVNCI